MLATGQDVQAWFAEISRRLTVFDLPTAEAKIVAALATQPKASMVGQIVHASTGVTMALNSFGSITNAPVELACDHEGPGKTLIPNRDTERARKGRIESLRFEEPSHCMDQPATRFLLRLHLNFRRTLDQKVDLFLPWPFVSRAKENAGLSANHIL
jgi:hypothetical protein